MQARIHCWESEKKRSVKRIVALLAASMKSIYVDWIRGNIAVEEKLRLARFDGVTASTLLELERRRFHTAYVQVSFAYFKRHVSFLVEPGESIEMESSDPHNAIFNKWAATEIARTLGCPFELLDDSANIDRPHESVMAELREAKAILFPSEVTISGMMASEVVALLCKSIPLITVDWNRGQQYINDHVARLHELSAPAICIDEIESHRGQAVFVEMSFPNYPDRSVNTFLYLDHFIELISSRPEDLAFLEEAASIVSKALGYSYRLVAAKPAGGR